MNHSPLFLQSLNRLIGKTMRRVQLAKCGQRGLLQSAVYWLNSARRAYKKGLQRLAMVYLENAFDRVQSARKAS